MEEKLPLFSPKLKHWEFIYSLKLQLLQQMQGVDQGSTAYPYP